MVAAGAAAMLPAATMRAGAARAATCMRPAAAMRASRETRPAAAMRAAHRPVSRSAAMRAVDRDMGRSAMRTTLVSRRAAVEHGPAGTGRCCCAMGRGCAMETLAAARHRAAMRGRRAMVRRFIVEPGAAAADRGRAETPAGTAGLAARSGNVRAAAKSRRRGCIAGAAGTGSRRQGGYPRAVEARPGGRVGIGNAAAMGGVVHPYITREGRAPAGGERPAAGVDGDIATPPVDPAPAP